MKVRHTNRIQSPRYPRNYADSRDMFTLLGVQGDHWPDAGVPPLFVQGIRVWVEPIRRREDGRKSSKHRVKFLCPNCTKTFSVGRMHQHECDIVEAVEVHPADDKTNQREPY